MDYESIKLLAKQEKCRVTSLLAMTQQNDPFYVGTPASLRDAEWFAEHWRKFGYEGQTVHQRRVYYRFVNASPPVKLPLTITGTDDGRKYSTDVFINTERCAHYLAMASRYARDLGLVSDDAFVDHKSSEPHIFSVSGDDDPGLEYDVYDGCVYSTSLISPSLPRLPDNPFELPHFSVSGFGGIEQPYLIEVWIEKTTMNDVLIPVCRKYGVNLVAGEGEISKTRVVELLRDRIANRHDIPARIAYISDFDPCGDDMPVSIARKIEFYARNRFPDLDIRLDPIALTAEQVRSYKLPRIPIKESDNRKEKFEERFGVGATELDALEAIHPGGLARILESWILHYHDPKLQERADEERERVVDEIDEERESIVYDYRDDIKSIRDDYKALLAEYEPMRKEYAKLVKPFQKKIDAFNAKLNGISTRWQVISDNVRERLESVPLAYDLPEPDLPEEGDGALYDSSRDYLEQMEFYKARNSLRGLTNGKNGQRRGHRK